MRMRAACQWRSEEDRWRFAPRPAAMGAKWLRVLPPGGQSSRQGLHPIGVHVLSRRIVHAAAGREGRGGRSSATRKHHGREKHRSRAPPPCTFIAGSPRRGGPRVSQGRGPRGGHAKRRGDPQNASADTRGGVGRRLERIGGLGFRLSPSCLDAEQECEARASRPRQKIVDVFRRARRR